MIPSGATHFIPANQVDFIPTEQFFKWAEVMWLPESCRHLKGWFFWTGGTWVRDSSFSNRMQVLKPIKEFPVCTS